MWPPPLLRDRPRAHQVVACVVAPLLFGALCGWLLGESDTAYQVLVALGVIGGVNSGFEHATARQGLVRGIVGGVLFAAAIVAVHELRSVAAAADLPADLGVMAAIYAVFGAAFGALGGWLRARHEARRALPAD